MLTGFLQELAKIKRRQWLAFLAIAILAMLGNWLADQFGAVLSSLSRQTLRHLMTGGICLGLFLLISAILYLHRSSLLGTESIASVPDFGGKRALILFVSTQSPHCKFEKDTQFPLTISWPVPPHNPKENRAVTLKGELHKDLQGLNEKECPWNWVALLRGIAPHLDSRVTLRHIYLIGSATVTLPTPDGTKRGAPPGSFDQLEACQAFLKPYLTPFAHVAVTAHAKPVSFEDHNQLVAALRTAIRFLHKERGIHRHEIVVDVTGGQKPTSIAGASATVNQSVWIQYVSTQYPFRVTGYNLRTAESDDAD